MKWPGQKRLKKLQDEVRAKTSRLDGRSLNEIVAELLQWLLDGRGKGIGVAHHQRWPNQWFAQCGLLSWAAEHEWTRTIVKLRTH